MNVMILPNNMHKYLFLHIRLLVNSLWCEKITCLCLVGLLEDCISDAWSHLHRYQLWIDKTGCFFFGLCFLQSRSNQDKLSMFISFKSTKHSSVPLNLSLSSKNSWTNQEYVVVIKNDGWSSRRSVGSCQTEIINWEKWSWVVRQQ